MASTEKENRCVAIRKIWQEGAWPCFSPDGRQLVFTGLMDHPNNRLMMLPVEGGEKPRIITLPHMNAKRPTWLSASTQIAFNRDQKTIWTIDLATDRLEPFLPESSPEAPPYLHPCAYPNERAVVVVSFWNSANGRSGVLYKLTPGAVVPAMQLTTFPEVCAGRPGVSPDGETVVFAGNAGEFAQSANQLWVVTANVCSVLRPALPIPTKRGFVRELLRPDGNARPGWRGERTDDGPLPDSHVRFELECFDAPVISSHQKFLLGSLSKILLAIMPRSSPAVGFSCKL